jgi:hypothetical protein
VLGVVVVQRWAAARWGGMGGEAAGGAGGGGLPEMDEEAGDGKKNPSQGRHRRTRGGPWRGHGLLDGCTHSSVGDSV